jgi:hypothetical protein
MTEKSETPVADMVMGLTTPKLEIRIRDPRPNDWAFISDSYRKSYRDQFPWSSLQQLNLETTRRLIRYRSAPKVRFLVACPPEEEDLILGWVCLGRRNLIHYVFVKQAFRGANVAKRLCSYSSGQMLVVTHWSRACEKINRLYRVLLYEPSKQ